MTTSNLGRSSGRVSSTKYFSHAQVKPLIRGSWFDYLVHKIKVDPAYLSGRPCSCPICRAGHDRWTWDNKDRHGTFICRHEDPQAGDGFELVRRLTGWSVAEVLRSVAAFVGLDTDSSLSSYHAPTPAPALNLKTVTANAQDRARMLKLWDSAQAIQPGDVVHRYLTFTRGLRLSIISDQLRFHRSCGYWEQDPSTQQFTKLGLFPAMLARIETPDGTLANIHRTYLTKYAIKAPVTKQKKLMFDKSGASAGGVIKLFQPGDCLGITEGIENALACEMDTGIPTWAAYSAGALGKAILPESVREIIVFADNDITGQANATKLADRLARESRLVKILTPPNPYKDWADVVTGGIK